MVEWELFKQASMRIDNNMDIFSVNFNGFSVLPRRNTSTFVVLHMPFLPRGSYIKE